MRIVALSDTHGRHDDLDVPDGDLLVHAGDLTRHGRLEELADIDDWFGLRPHPEKVAVAGNHDACLERTPRAARQRLTHVDYLEDEALDVQGWTLWGSPWTPQFFDWSFMRPRGAELASVWAAIPDETDILVTHGPPAGILDEAHGGVSTGSETLLERVREVEPRIHIFGHIHEARGRETRGPTLFVNASCFDGGAPFVLDL